jgi:AraC-like DNA-binding protein
LHFSAGYAIKIIELDKKTKQTVVESIPVYEEKKEIKSEIKINKKEVSDELIDKINEIKKIRINNSLAKFNKKQLSEFKNIFGISPNQYVITKRITMAKRLLRFSDMTLEEISEKCGFYDPSYLNKQFKSSEGLTASEFRRKWTN